MTIPFDDLVEFGDRRRDVNNHYKPVKNERSYQSQLVQKLVIYRGYIGSKAEHCWTYAIGQMLNTVSLSRRNSKL